MEPGRQTTGKPLEPLRMKKMLMPLIAIVPDSASVLTRRLKTLESMVCVRVDSLRGWRRRRALLETRWASPPRGVNTTPVCMYSGSILGRYYSMALGPPG